MHPGLGSRCRACALVLSLNVDISHISAQGVHTQHIYIYMYRLTSRRTHGGPQRFSWFLWQANKRPYPYCFSFVRGRCRWPVFALHDAVPNTLNNESRACHRNCSLSLSLSPTHTHNGRNRDVRHSTLDWVTRSQTGGRDRSTHESLEIVLIFPLTHNPLNLDEAKCVKTT